MFLINTKKLIYEYYEDTKHDKRTKRKSSGSLMASKYRKILKTFWDLAISRIVEGRLFLAMKGWQPYF